MAIASAYIAMAMSGKCLDIHFWGGNFLLHHSDSLERTDTARMAIAMQQSMAMNNALRTNAGRDSRGRKKRRSSGGWWYMSPEYGLKSNVTRCNPSFTNKNNIME